MFRPPAAWLGKGLLLKLGIVATAAGYWVLGILQGLTAIRI